MPPKKEFFKNVQAGEDFEPYYAEDYKKLVVVDLYAAWAGPTEAMRDFWKFLNNTPLIEDFTARCDVLQMEKTKVSYFENYKINSRPKFLLIREGRVVAEVNGPNCPMLFKLIQKHLPAYD